MDQIDDRTFRANFSADGVALLKQRVDDKLKEYMGDYTDDTLVEYVIVLLRNGRRKEEAKSELDVFLGDDSESFVLWLWDHLASNLDQYVESSNAAEDETLKPKATSADVHQDLDKEQVESDKTSKSRHSRKWRGLTSNEYQPPQLRSCVVDEAENQRKTSRNHDGYTKRSVSPNPPPQRKRSRASEREHGNKHENEHEQERSKLKLNATSRLLQFAVRDAVATTKPSHSATEPGAKRLRSVVSTPTTSESVQKGRTHRVQSVARAPNTMTAAIKAVAEAAEDVVKARSTRNVFDRLNRAVAAPESIEDLSLYKNHTDVVDKYEDYYHHQEQMDYLPKVDNRQVERYQTLEKTRHMHVEQGNYSGKYTGSATMLHSNTGMASDSASDNEGYDDINVVGRRRIDVSQTGSSSGRKREGSLMVQYTVAQNAEKVSLQQRPKERDPPISAASASRKILNISVNVNTWKPPHYQPQSDATELDTQRSLQQNEVRAGKSSVQFTKENSNSLALNGNGKAALQILNETEKSVASGPGPYTTGRPLEDADSRSIFVNNVHFAATKDSLTRHFNKFGEVLKVVILTDAATGQAKGSAYVEFMRKEAAENALSLDGTSFMSRILKVGKKSPVPQEGSPATTRPRVSQALPFAASRFSRAPFPRGFAGAFRARPQVKPGARSMQWKRDTQPTMSDNASSVTGSVPPSVGRGFTYIRTETKPTGQDGAV
ncbi:hypothetical protein V2J09_023273 [Rumex salicifolius]